jgi:hypothetical protein
MIEFGGFDPGRDAPIEPEGRVLSKPWLAVRLNFYGSMGRGNYEATGRLLR